ncbi:hypothetical protein Tco_0756521, partial [Tanacetum coccineum]
LCDRNWHWIRYPNRSPLQVCLERLKRVSDYGFGRVWDLAIGLWPPVDPSWWLMAFGSKVLTDGVGGGDGCVSLDKMIHFGSGKEHLPIGRRWTMFLVSLRIAQMVHEFEWRLWP